jgi:mono/diheme cytochrome c family protein
MRRTERLVHQRLACLGCHALGGEGGRIGPRLDGVAARLQPSFVRAVVADPARVVPGSGMPRQHLEARDADRVAAYLLQREGGWAGGEQASLADTTHPADLAARAQPAGDGEALYLRHCAACHGTGGRGDGFNAPLLPVPPTVHASAEVMARRPDDSLFDGIHAGAYVLDGSPRMPPFGAMLDPDQIRALVGYIRQLCACREPEWAGGGWDR